MGCCVVVNRKRPVHRAVTFSEDEWARVLVLMGQAGESNFSRFARTMVLKGQVVVDENRADLLTVSVALARIGNNVNQIARKVNVDDFASLEQVQATRELMGQVQALLVGALGDRRQYGRG